MRTANLKEWIGKTDDSRIPDSVRDRVARKTGDCCTTCRRSLAGKLRAEMDHIVPLILGGEHRERNLQLLCHECHGAKTKLDVKLKAKVARVRKKNLGFRKPRTITRWRKFNGDVVEAPRQRS